MDVDLSNQEQAIKFKEQGNDAYKKKDFEKALELYNKAIELDSNNMVYYTNVAAVLFEQKEYDKCTDTCIKAVDIGRENEDDFKLIAILCANWQRCSEIRRLEKSQDVLWKIPVWA